jgi:hypothetical protein
MTPKLFRTLLIINAGLSFARVVVTIAFPELVPENVRIADEKTFEESVDGTTFATTAFAVVLIVASTIAFVGLYMFKPWSRKVNLLPSSRRTGDGRAATRGPALCTKGAIAHGLRPRSTPHVKRNPLSGKLYGRIGSNLPVQDRVATVRYMADSVE